MVMKVKDKTEEKYVSGMKACIKVDDTENAHSNADDLLCKFLIELGYKTIVAEYRKVEKWYS